MAAGSQTVQQQALRDFAQAMRNFFAGTHRRPTWRKAGVHEGFRQVAVKARHVERLNRRFGRVLGAQSRLGASFVTMSLATGSHSPTSRIRSRVRARAPWWVSIAVWWCRRHCRRANCCTRPASPRVSRSGSRCCSSGWPAPGAAPTGELAQSAPIAKLKARETDRRKDWVEKITTDIARRFDTIRIEALDVPAMTRSARGTVEQPGVTGRTKTRPQPGHPPKRMGSARRAAAAQGFWSGRADPGRVHVATMLRMRACRTRKP